MGQKWDLSALLQGTLKFDEHLTDLFCSWANRFLPLRSLRIHYKLLEVSCHGIPWISCWLAFIWVWDQPALYQMQVNFMLGLLFDIVFIASLKAWTRRSRPSANRTDMFAAVGPDKYSFPSGHASRACFIVYFFLYLWPLPFFCIMPLMAWSTSVCVSRLLLRRHHVLDVTAGALLGHVEGYIISILWLSEELSQWFVSWLSDENLEGGSYHV